MDTTLAPGESTTLSTSLTPPADEPSLGSLRFDVEAGDVAVVGDLRAADLASVPSGDSLALALDAGGANTPLLPTYQRLTPEDR